MGPGGGKSTGQGEGREGGRRKGMKRWDSKHQT